MLAVLMNVALFGLAAARATLPSPDSAAPPPPPVLPKAPQPAPAAPESGTERPAGEPAEGTAGARALAEEKDPGRGPKFEARWNNGLFSQTRQKDFVAHVGGVLHYDAAWYSAAPGLEVFPGGPGEFHDGVTPRRARIRAEGTFHRRYDYLFEVDFANSQAPAGQNPPSAANAFAAPRPIELWLAVREVPGLGTVRAGYHREPFSLEQMANWRTFGFLERSYLFDASQVSAYTGGRSPGVSASRTWLGDRVFTAGGVFKNVSNPFGFGVGDGEYAATGRVTWLPVWRPDDRAYWLVGGAVSRRDPVGEEVRVRVRGSVRAAPGPLLNLLADTGAVGAESQTLFNLQTVATAGPVSVQAEYLADRLAGARVGAGPPLGVVRYQGFYAQALYLLTGESRGFDPATATQTRVVPARDFGDGGWGAWEVGARYTLVDLNDGGVAGGRVSSVTVGANWYWTQNVKLQVNYDYADLSRGLAPPVRGGVHSFGGRLAFEF